MQNGRMDFSLLSAPLVSPESSLRVNLESKKILRGDVSSQHHMTCACVWVCGVVCWVEGVGESVQAEETCV